MLARGVEGNSAGGPTFVGVDVEVVVFADHEAFDVEEFGFYFDTDDSFEAFGVLGAAGEEVAGDELVDAPFVGSEAIVVLGGNFDGVDWWMGLIVVAAVSGPLEFVVVDEFGGVVSPDWVILLEGDESSDI